LIAGSQPMVDSELAAAMEDGVLEIVTLDQTHGTDLHALGTLLLRTESVASSKIEQIDASVDDYARALHGIKANQSATSMVAATAALSTLIHAVEGGHDITRANIECAHRSLMADDPHQRSYAGRPRDMQNWIGGSDYSPRNAVYVPPPPDTVDGYLADLVSFSNRGDLPVLAQAAIAHAQFESIHPFTDGNGRIGRALINTILRRRGTTNHVVVPLASALVADRDRYFDVLTDYREGHIEPIILAITTASRIAAVEARVTAGRIATFPHEWRDSLGPVRRGSAADRLLATMTTTPIFSAEDAHDRIGGPASSMYSAIDRLHAAGVLRPLTDRKRNRVWGVSAMLDELDDLGQRIASQARIHIAR
jgi:Fic family protein